MATLIEDYEQQYAVITAEITAEIGKLRHTTYGERKELITKINNNIGEAQELLEQIGLEIRDANSTVRPVLTNRLNSYQAEMKRLQQEFLNVKNVKINPSAGYESNDEFEEIGMNDDQKRRLLDNSERIERTGNKLEEGYRVVLETEQMGTQVLQDLSQQRETLQRARSRLHETNADLGRSSRLMTSMIIRSLQEKAVLIGVALVFIIVVSLSIYFSISSK